MVPGGRQSVSRRLEKGGWGKIFKKNYEQNDPKKVSATVFPIWSQVWDKRDDQYELECLAQETRSEEEQSLLQKAEHVYGLVFEGDSA